MHRVAAAGPTCHASRKVDVHAALRLDQQACRELVYLVVVETQHDVIKAPAKMPKRCPDDGDFGRVLLHHEITLASRDKDDRAT